MKGHFGAGTRQFRLIVGILVSLAIGNQPLLSDSQATATLKVQVQPEAFTEIAGIPSWISSGDSCVLQVPVKVKIRLNNGSHALFSVASPMVEGVAPSPEQIETDSGLLEVSNTPKVIQTYSRSGIYQETIVLRTQPGQKPESIPERLILSLTSSDGQTGWTQTVVVPPTPVRCPLVS